MLGRCWIYFPRSIFFVENLIWVGSRSSRRSGLVCHHSKQKFQLCMLMLGIYFHLLLDMPIDSFFVALLLLFMLDALVTTCDQFLSTVSISFGAFIRMAACCVRCLFYLDVLYLFS